MPRFVACRRGFGGACWLADPTDSHHGGIFVNARCLRKHLRISALLFTLTLPEPGPSVTFLTPCSCSTRVFTFFGSPAFFSHWTFFQELEQEWPKGCRKRGGRTKKRGNVPHPCPLQQTAWLRPWVGQWGGRPKLQSHALASHCHRGHLSAGGSLGTNGFKINISQFHENGI